MQGQLQADQVIAANLTMRREYEIMKPSFIILGLFILLCSALSLHLLFVNWCAIYKVAVNQIDTSVLGFTIDLPPTPIWSPPSPPPYSEFVKEYGQDKRLVEGGQFAVELDQDKFLRGIILQWFWIFVGYSVLYFAVGSLSESFVGKICFWCGLGLIGGCVASFLVSAYQIQFLAIDGLLIGLGIGIIHTLMKNHFNAHREPPPPAPPR